MSLEPLSSDVPRQTIDCTCSSHEVARLLGISYRQLDYWCRTGAVGGKEGHGSGSRRRWTQPEIERLARVVEQYVDALQVVERFHSGDLWREAA